jgi:hypothetical protein
MVSNFVIFHHAQKSSRLFLLSWSVWEGDTVCWHYIITLWEFSVLDRVYIPWFFAQHASQEAPGTRFFSFKVLFQGLTDSAIYYHFHHPKVACAVLLSCLCSSFCPEANWWRWQCQCFFGITLQFTILVAWSPPIMSPPLQWQSEHNCAGKKSISQIWLDQPAA